MPHLGSNVPAMMGFPLFNHLPKELRVQIWESALPGPRIIYVQRVLTSGDNHESVWGPARRNGTTPGEPSHFMSASPNDSLMPLFLACKESHSVITKEYSVIFPASSTWFSFSTDFLYLDWGMIHDDKGMGYSAENFTASYVDEDELGIFKSPEIDENVAKRVRNLVVHDNWRWPELLESWLVNDVLRVFSGVEVLVMADRLHHADDVVKKLVWLRGELGDESRWLSELWSRENGDEERGLHDEPKAEQGHRRWLGELLLWRDRAQHAFCRDIVPSLLEKAWNGRRVLTGRRELPAIFRKSVTTAEVKKKLLKICGSEDDFQKLDGLDSDFVEGGKKYGGPLDLSQQIAYLNLALDRLLPKYTIDGHGNTEPSENKYYISDTVAKIEDLWREATMDQLISEAEEMDYNQSF
jgi:hypothetical protein